jgi:hypothetical protein
MFIWMIRSCASLSSDVENPVAGSLNKSRVIEMRFFGGLTVEETALVESVARHGDGRLAARESVAAARNARRSIS